MRAHRVDHQASFPGPEPGVGARGDRAHLGCRQVRDDVLHARRERQQQYLACAEPPGSQTGRYLVRGPVEFPVREDNPRGDLEGGPVAVSAGGLSQYPGEHRRSGRRSGQSSAVDRAEDGFRGAGDDHPVVADGGRPVDQPRVVQQVIGHGGDGSAHRLRRPV